MDEEYDEAYRHGFEDATPIYADKPHVVVYLNSDGSYTWIWHNIELSSQAETLVDGLEEVVERIEEAVADSRPDEDDDE